MDNSTKKISLSGVKPTGRPHIGNYFGAMKGFVDRQNDYHNFIFIADLHALTTAQDPIKLRADILDLAIDYLAIGLDPNQVTLFCQSTVPAHTELAWIFNCITTMPYLMRAHAYKDAEAKNKEINVGLFDYPVLMAADILLYNTDLVPVGADQKQHVEYARDIAEKFNHLYGETFKLPEPLIDEQVKTIIGLDGQKMSKSYGNTIPLFADEKEIKRLVMTIKTDSKEVNEPKNPEECNIFALHKLFSSKDLPELKRRYVDGGIGYKESKDILIENMNTYLKPLREKRETIASDPFHVEKILAQGGQKAQEITQVKIKEIKNKIGLLPQ